MKRTVGLIVFTACWRGSSAPPPHQAPLDVRPPSSQCGPVPSNDVENTPTIPPGPCVGEQVALADGRVLVVGKGCASLWARSRWSAVATPPGHGDGGTLIRTAGGAMLIGGGTKNGEVVTDVSLFDARTGRWRLGAPLNVPRAVHSAIALRDGRVLVAGGCNDVSNDDSCMNGDFFVGSYEIYDPNRNRWQLTPLRMDHVRFDAALVQLADGRVLALGGSVGDTLEPPPTLVWDGASWCAAPPLLGARFRPHAELLADGESILVTGKADNDGPAAEVFRFAKGCRCKR